MATDRATGEITDESDEDVDRPAPPRDNVRPLPPRERGGRRTSISGSQSVSSDDSRTLMAHNRTIEVEGASDRLGLDIVKGTLESSEQARRLLTQDLVDAKERHDVEIDRVRDEYERAASASESRHSQEARRWREERDRLQREVEKLERAVKDEKKAKKKHKKSVQAAEFKLAELRDAGESKRAIFGLLAPGVPPLAAELAKNIPDLFALFRSVVPARPEPSPGAGDEAVRDRAAAIRFAGRLFDPLNDLAAGALEDLERLAFDMVDRDGETVFVSEWDRVQRHVWAALRREAEAAVPDAKVVSDVPTGGE